MKRACPQAARKGQNSSRYSFSDDDAKVMRYFQRSLGAIFYRGSIFHLIIGRISGTYIVVNSPSSPDGAPEDATVIRLSTHIPALSAENAWSSYRPSDRCLMRVVRSGSVSFNGKQPEQAFKTPG
jgi:hypothetical protein